MFAAGTVLPAMAGQSAIPAYLTAGAAGNGLFGLTSGEQGGLGSMLGGLLSLFGNQNPADEAMPYLNQIEGQTSKYMSPYINAGLNSMGTLQSQFNNMLSNPTSLMSLIGNNFQQSPGYQWQTNQAEGAANRAAAAGGMLGSPMHQQNAASMVNNLANQDYYNFMDRGINNFNQGINGLSNINQLGYGASQNMSNNLLQSLLSKAMLSYAGTANQNQSMGGGLGALAMGAASFM